MSVEIYRGSPGKFDSRTLSRETLDGWTGRIVSMHRQSWSVIYAGLVLYGRCLARGCVVPCPV